jgi:hypothetical protein
MLAFCHHAPVSIRPTHPERVVAEITAEGARAAYTLSGVLVVSGTAFAVAAADELWRRCPTGSDACATSAAAAGLVTLVSIAAIAAGIALFRGVRRRPVDPGGSSRFVIGLGILFALGVWLVAWRIPPWTCARGRFDPVLELCMHPPTTSEPTSWALDRLALALLALAGGAVIALRPRWVRVTAPLSVLAWACGAGWLLVGTLVR